MSFKITAAAALLALACASTSSSAFEISSPSSDHYWVACANNTLTWSANSTDASEFSVALIDVSNTPGTPSLVNGNYQIANSLRTDAGSAVIELNCVTPSSSYQLLFVNSSQYELEHPQVFAQFGIFDIKPNGTAPASSSSSGTPTNSGFTTVTTSTAPSTASPSSGSGNTGGAFARVGVAASVLFGAVLAAAVAVVA
ncbi:hypothetical protein V8E36_002443 [Tilletia maclaganii]